MEMLVSIMPYIAGPASAVVVLALILFGIGTIFYKKILPMIESGMNRHLDANEKLIVSHDEDREVWSETIET